MLTAGWQSAFSPQLPYIVIALLVFAIFYIAAQMTRRMIGKLTERRKQHRNVGLAHCPTVRAIRLGCSALDT